MLIARLHPCVLEGITAAHRIGRIERGLLRFDEHSEQWTVESETVKK
jgi:hypothetical protein